MKKLFLMLLIACIWLSFQSCHYYENQVKKKEAVLNSWMGTHKSKLIAQWGPPTKYDSDGKGGEILMYEQSKVLSTYTYGTWVQNVVIYYTYMYADPKGYLYHWNYGQK